MADFYIDVEKELGFSEDMHQIAVKLKKAQYSLEKVKLNRSIDVAYGVSVSKSIKIVLENISDEVVKMNSMRAALQAIANTYQKTEADIGSFDFSNAGSTTVGSDKRNWWNKFWDWITGKEPDEYDLTKSEQEKAADSAMKKELWNILQDEKYSQENWDKSSLDERKNILQDYMNEVIKIYGVQDVKSNIIWDNKATYNENSITWGYYTHGRHTVTLNAQALMDSVGNWDSYELLETVSHELRHAYQHEAINHPTDYLVSKETIDIWKENFDNYIKSEDDYEGYRNQPVEVDARDFQVTRDDMLQ